MERIDSLDYFRAICSIYIIAFWHLDGYFFHDLPIYALGLPITKVCLSGFTFLSGYLNGKNNKNAITFYCSRIKRLIIPFIFSYFTLVSIGFIPFSAPGMINAFTGLCMFCEPCPLTLWFVSMLILLYAVSPILKKGMIASMIIYAIIIFGFLIGNHDTRIVIFSIFYILGFNISQDTLTRFLQNNNIVLIYVLFVLCYGLSLYYRTNKEYVVENIWIDLLTCMSGVICLLKLSHPPHSISIFKRVSYASLFAYLFHRFIYYSFFHIFGWLPSWFIIPLMVICTFVISYFMQFYYNKLLLKLDTLINQNSSSI